MTAAGLCGPTHLVATGTASGLRQLMSAFALDFAAWRELAMVAVRPIQWSARMLPLPLPSEMAPW